MERPYQRPVPGPHEMRAPHHPAGGGAETARAQAHTHERDTRGLPEGQTDRARGTHRPHGMAYRRARVRDTRKGPGHGKGAQGRGQGAQVQGAGRGEVGERAGQGVGDGRRDPRHGQGA